MAFAAFEYVLPAVLKPFNPVCVFYVFTCISIGADYHMYTLLNILLQGKDFQYFRCHGPKYDHPCVRNPS